MHLLNDNLCFTLDDKIPKNSLNHKFVRDRRFENITNDNKEVLNTHIQLLVKDTFYISHQTNQFFNVASLKHGNVIIARF